MNANTRITRLVGGIHPIHSPVAQRAVATFRKYMEGPNAVHPQHPVTAIQTARSLYLYQEVRLS